MNDDTIANQLGNTFRRAALEMMAEQDQAKPLYVALMIHNNRVLLSKVFDKWDEATDFADQMVMDIGGVTDDLPDWEGGDYRTVWEHKSGLTITIETMEKPGMIDARYQSPKYGVNVK